jgi:Zn-dependent protease
MALSLPAIIIALTFHEYAHGRMAYALGDDTAARMGRLTLSPFPHLDPIGFFMLVFAHFGWAKPVPFNPNNFYSHVNRKRGTLLVALAGPMMNLSLAVAGAFLWKVMLMAPSNEWLTILIVMVQNLVGINLILAAFNLIPVPPLDGSKILAGLLPDSAGQIIYALERYGFVILLLLIMTNTTSKIISPLVNQAFSLLYHYIVM